MLKGLRKQLGFIALNKGQRENDEIKLRPPPPLLAKGSPRMPIKSSSSATGSIISGSSSNNTSSTAKRPELEVRKDLTLPTAPTGKIIFALQNQEFDAIGNW